MIEAEHLFKQYGDKQAVRDVSFSVAPGEIVGLLGPNGAGKSTILGMLTGYLSPSAGAVRIGGADILEEPYAARKKIGYLPEIPPLYPDMTVDEQLSFAFELKQLEKKRKRDELAEVCGAVGIKDIRGRLIRNLSKGLRQRVGLAQALLGRPEVLLLDEPGEGLDPRQNREIREVIREIGKSCTVVFSSHILQEVSLLCRRILVLDQGRLIADGRVSELMSHMDGAPRFLLEVAGEAETIARALRGVPGVEDVRLEESGEALWRVTLAARPGADVRRDVFTALAGAGCPMLLFRPVEHSLEELFLRLVSRPAEGGEER